MGLDEEALMWVEKYRPKNLAEVVDLHDVVESLKAFLKTLASRVFEKGEFYPEFGCARTRTMLAL